MISTKLLLITLTLFLYHFSMGQLAFTTGISNKMQTDKYSDIPFYYQGHYRSIINEKNAVDGFSLGLEFKRNNFILVGDIALDFHNLEINTYDSHHTYQQSSYSTTLNFGNYNVNCGFLGIRLSPQFQIIKKRLFRLTLGPSILVQHRLYEKEFNHYDSTYHKFSAYSGMTNSYLHFVTTSSSSANYDGMTIFAYTGRFGLLINPRIELGNSSVVLNVAAGIGATARFNNLKIWGVYDNKVYLFLEYGLKYVRQL